ncbi:hypothetical protein DIPPA_31870 [Diplonema papillatum]|nr:hypothetical protein DIPPA_31870 [Diplonema papillatum]
MDSPTASQVTDHSVGGISPDWYCSAGGREEDLKKEVRMLHEKSSKLEELLEEKRAELVELHQALRDERKMEVESLSNMKSGSEKLLEQKGQQVLQLNNTIRKLNDTLRKKDQKMSALVQQNLRADAAFTDTSTELSELKVSLRHVEADLHKERLGLQRFETQATALSTQNSRLDELLQQYRAELAKKDSALNAKQMDDQHQDRARHILALDAVETLGEASSHLTRLGSELEAQETSLLAGIGLQARTHPAIVRPGQKVKLLIASQFDSVPIVASVSNASSVSEVEATVADGDQFSNTASTDHFYEATFVAGPREGTAVILLSSNNVSAQAVTVVEGLAASVDIGGSTISLDRAQCHVGEPVKISIVTRNVVGELVSADVISREIAVTPTASPRFSLKSSRSSFPPNDSFRDNASFGSLSRVLVPTMRVSGATITEHIAPTSNYSHHLIVTPTSTRVSVHLADEVGVIAGVTFEAREPRPEYEKTQLEYPKEVTVGDRVVAKVKIFDSRGLACGLPRSTPASDVIRIAARPDDDAEEAVDISEEVVELEYGVYGLYFSPLAVGRLSLRAYVGDTYLRSIDVAVQSAGGPAALDHFQLHHSSPDYCVPIGSEINFTVSFTDASHRPASAAPEPSVLQFSFSKASTFSVYNVSPDDNAPSSLSVTLLAERAGETEVTVSCRGGAAKQSFSACSTGGKCFGAPSGVHLSTKPCMVLPGASFELIATPKDAVGNALMTLPSDRRAQKLTASIEGCENACALLPKSGYWSAILAAPLTPGFYRVTAGGAGASFEVSSDVTVAAWSLSEDVKNVVNRIPGIMHSMTILESMVRTARADAHEAVLKSDRLSVRAEEERKLASEEIRNAEETAARDREAMQSRHDTLKAKLAAALKEQRDLQQRWEEREDVFERERHRFAEDRRLWIEERDRLTLQEEDTTALIAQLRQEKLDLQAKLKQQQQNNSRNLQTQADDLRQLFESERAQWISEKASLEARIGHANERVEDFKSESEHACRRYEEVNITVEQLEHTVSNLKGTIQDLQLKRDQLELQLSKSDDDKIEALHAQHRKFEEQERLHAQTALAASQTHAEDLARVRREMSDLKELHKGELEAITSKWEAKRVSISSHAAQERSRFLQEKEEFQSAIDSLNTQVRMLTRELQTEREKMDSQFTVWETEKRTYEKRIEEHHVVVTESERRYSEEIQMTKSTVDRDRTTWVQEKQTLQQKVQMVMDEMSEVTKQHRVAIAQEHHAFEKERQTWVEERHELTISRASLQEQIEDIRREHTHAFQEETQRNEDMRLQWLRERTELKQKVNELQLLTDDLHRKNVRTVEDMQTRLDDTQQDFSAQRDALTTELAVAKETHAEQLNRLKKEVATLKSHADAAKQEHLRTVDRLEHETASLEEQQQAEKKRAAKEAKALRDTFELERDTMKRDAAALKQQVDGLKAGAEELRKRHASQMDEIDAERKRWAEERTSLRERLTEIEATGVELAEEHRMQIEEFEQVLVSHRKEADTVLSNRLAQQDAAHEARLRQLSDEIEAKYAAAAAENMAERARLEESHRAELARFRLAAAEREKLAEQHLESVKNNFKTELDALKAEFAKAKAEKQAARQRWEQERAAEMQRMRQQVQDGIEASERAKEAWDEERDGLWKKLDEAKTEHKREAAELQRQVHSAGLEKLEKQEEAAHRELLAQREHWEKQLASVRDAHESDLTAFAREREDWRAERTKLWNDRNASKQQLESTLLDVTSARDEAQTEVGMLSEDKARLTARLSELQQELAQSCDALGKTTADGQRLAGEREDWKAERTRLREDVTNLELKLVRQQQEVFKLQQEKEELRTAQDDHKSEALSRAQKRIDDLQDEIDANRSASLKLQREVTRLSTQLEDERQRTHDTAEKLQTELRDEQKRHAAALVSLQHEHTHAVHDSGGLRQRIQELESTLHRAHASHSDAQQQAAAEHEELRLKLADAQQRLQNANERGARDADELRAAAASADAKWAQKEAAWSHTAADLKDKMERELRSKSEQLNALRRTLDDDAEEHQHTVNALRKQLEESQGSLSSEKEVRHQSEVRTREKLELEKQTWDREKAYLAQQVEKYKSLLKETDQKQSSLVDTVSAERQQWASERARLNQEVNQLSKDLADKEQRYHNQLEQRTREMNGLRSEENRFEGESRRLRDELDALRHELEAKEAQWERELQQQKELVVTERKRLSVKIEEVEYEYDHERNAAKRTHASEIGELQAKLQDAQAAIDDERRRLKSIRDSENEKLSLLESERGISHMRLADERAEWHAERDSLLSEANSLRANQADEIAGLSLQISNLQDDLDRERGRFKQELGRSRADMEKQLQLELEAAEAEKQQLITDRRRWEEERTDLEDRVADLNKELDAAHGRERKARDETLRVAAATQTGRDDQWTNERQDLLHQLADLNRQITDANRRIEEVEIETADKMQKDFDAFLADLDREREKKDDDRQALAEEVERLTQKCNRIVDEEQASSTSPHSLANSVMSFSIDAVRSALQKEFGTLEKAVEAILKDDIADKANVHAVMELVGLENWTQDLISAAVEKGKGSLYDGITQLLLGGMRKYERAMQDYDEAAAREQQLAEQSKRVLASQKSKADVTKVETSTATLRSSKKKPEYSRFGLEVTDGVRLGKSDKYDYCGVKVVRTKGAAKQAGVEAGDVINEVNGERVANMEDFRRIAKSLSTDMMYVVVDRNGVETLMTIRPEQTHAPPGTLARYSRPVNVPPPALDASVTLDSPRRKESTPTQSRRKY